MAKKNKRKIIFIFFLLCFAFYLFVQCAKDDAFSKEQLNEMITANVDHGTSVIYTLPINLNKYNLLPLTKGVPIDTAYSIRVDSLLDYEGKRVMLFDSGWSYCQVPFKSNKIGIYAAIAPKLGEYKDSLVTIKCYYLLVESLKEPIRNEYSVTMIPTYTYHKNNPNYDFIDKPSFSGYILYSLKNGTFVRGEVYEGGALMDITLRAKTDTSANTKSYEEDWWNGISGPHFSLDAITVTPAVSMKDLQRWMDSNYKPNYNIEIQPQVDYVVDYGSGGGSGSDKKTRSAEMQYTVTCVIDNCASKSTDKVSITKGSVFTRTLPNDEGNCLFVAWIGSDSEVSSSNRTISFKVTKDVTVTAKYTSPTKNSACYKLMEFLGKEGRLQMIDTLIKLYTAEKEYAILIDNRGKITSVEGISGKVKLGNVFTHGTQYVCISHSHNSEYICTPSAEDIAFFILNRSLFVSQESAVFDIIGGNDNKDLFFLFALHIANEKRVTELYIDYLKNKNKYPSLEEFMENRIWEKIERKKLQYKLNRGNIFLQLTKEEELSIISPILKEIGLSYSLIDITRNSVNCLNFRWNKNNPGTSSNINKESINCFTQLYNK